MNARPHDIPSLSVDHLGGARLIGGSGTLRPNTPELRALDVVDSPTLRILDLRGCAEGLHLTLAGTPELRQILLPDSGPGAVIHIDACRFKPSLTIQGLLDEIDGCNALHTFALRSPAGAPYRRVTVGARIGRETEAAVLWRQMVRASEIAKRASALRHFHAVDTFLIGDVDLRACTQLRSLTLDDCGSTSRLALPGGMQEVVLHKVKDVRRLGGTGQLLRLYGCTTPRLLIEGGWEQVLLDDGEAPDVTAEDVDWLHLRGAQRVRDLTVGPQTQLWFQAVPPDVVRGGQLSLATDCDRTVARLLQNLEQGEPDATEQLRWFFARHTGDTGNLHRLLGLSRGLGRIDPGLLWELRCLTHAAHQPRFRQSATTLDQALEFAGQTWRWRFPVDLAGEGWLADLRLAEAALEQPATASFRKRLTRVSTLDNVQALGALLHSARREQRLSDLSPVLVDAFRGGCRRLVRNLRRQRRQFPAAAQVVPVIRGLVALRDRDNAHRLRVVIRDRAMPEGKLELLHGLAVHGLDQARSDLLAMLHEPIWGPGLDDLHYRVRRLALAPARSNDLATTDQHEETGNDGHH
ncbi:hypothetical protein M0534_01400 [Methylonatrum kenyense]|uniref:hypothetical protein n=1 Tax=Methylonatrum kenyense TaxID=455253 RepID=UPI0020C00A75|nr:hypothetical protein [Methylonatrum kenyense]MCK8514987.1 hypothetical protein [Methylonatrum kenyense]